MYIDIMCIASSAVVKKIVKGGRIEVLDNVWGVHITSAA